MKLNMNRIALRHHSPQDFHSYSFLSVSRASSLPHSVTATPVVVVTASRGVQQTRAVTTEFTSFVTSVTDVELWQTVTHTYTQFQASVLYYLP